MDPCRDKTNGQRDDDTFFAKLSKARIEELVVHERKAFVVTRVSASDGLCNAAI